MARLGGSLQENDVVLARHFVKNPARFAVFRGDARHPVRGADLSRRAGSGRGGRERYLGCAHLGRLIPVQRVLEGVVLSGLEDELEARSLALARGAS